MKPLIQFDYTHLIRKFSETQLHSLIKKKEAVRRDLKHKKEGGEIGFIDLIYEEGQAGQNKQNKLSPILNLAKQIQRSQDTLLIIGIGGSVLGAKAAISALAKNKRPKIIFIENPNPDSLNRLFQEIDLKKTTINVISKSGSTLETLSLFFVFYERMKKVFSARELKKRIIVTSEAKDNPLTTLAKQLEWQILPIPLNVAGRFSVLSSVGLFPMAVAGLSITKLLAGARWMHDEQRESYLYGTLAYGAHQLLKKSTTVIFPYDERLSLFGDWFCQIWAESLAKSELSGPTPMKAIGALDQHSLLQLFLEGPGNKWYTTIGIEQFDTDIKIPKTSLIKNFPYLQNTSLSEILNAEKTATEKSLIEYHNPLCRLTLPSLSEETLGALFFHFELATTAAGYLYQINPFNQPAVDHGKEWTKKLLHKKILAS